MLASCRRATELMSKQMEQSLSLQERFSLRVHLSLCAGCRRAKKQMQFLRRASKGWPDAE